MYKNNFQGKKQTAREHPRCYSGHKERNAQSLDGLLIKSIVYHVVAMRKKGVGR